MDKTENLEPEQAPRVASKKSRVVCLFFRQAGDWKVPLPEIAEACLRFTPRIAIREGEAIFLDITGCGSLYTEDGLILRLILLCKRFKFTPRIAIAADVPTALSLARYGSETRPKGEDHRVRKGEDLPLEALADYASPFAPLAHEDPRRKGLESIFKALRQLGLKTLDDFTRLPAGALATRFGKEGQQLSRQIRDALLQPWPLFKPAEKIARRLDLRNVDTLSPCADLEILMNHLDSLLGECTARMRGRGLRAAAVEVEFELEKIPFLARRTRLGEENFLRRWVVWLPVPQSSARGILPILRERIRFELERRPLPAPVGAVGLTVLETVRGRNRQDDFFKPSAEEVEAWEVLVARLCDKLGQHRAFSAEAVDRHLPERAWRRGLESALQPELPGPVGVVSPQGEILPVPERPSRVLKTPRALRRDEIESMRELKGPEKLGGEWWFDSEHRGFAREYYQVTMQGGERFWVFRGRDGGLYLHGYFD